MKSISLREYARHRKAAKLPGTTLRAVQVAIESGRLVASITRTKKVRSAEQADLEWAASTKAEHVPDTGPTAPVLAAPMHNALADARARREAAQASMREMELAKRRGELVSAKDIETKLTSLFAHCRTRMMDIPRKARQHDASLSAAHLVLLEALIREALEDLAEPENESDEPVAVE